MIPQSALEEFCFLMISSCNMQFDPNFSLVMGIRLIHYTQQGTLGSMLDLVSFGNIQVEIRNVLFFFFLVLSNPPPLLSDEVLFPLLLFLFIKAHHF